MPWLDENGLLPGRGAPGRPTGRGAGLGAFGVPFGVAGAGADAAAAGASGSAAGSGVGAGSATGCSTTGAGASTTGSGAGSAAASAGLGARPGGAFLAAGWSVFSVLPLAAVAVSGRLGRGGGLEGLADLLAETHLRGELDGRARRLDELAHLLELLENELALDAELLGEFVYSGLSHNSPSGPNPLPYMVEVR